MKVRFATVVAVVSFVLQLTAADARALTGDFDSDGFVTLKDTLFALQVCVGLPVSATQVQQDNAVVSAAGVSVAGAIYTLWVMAGLYKPLAYGGEDFTIGKGENATLDGSNSRGVYSDTLTFSWAFVSKPAGSQAVLQNADTVSPSFIADLEGEYRVTLMVNDGQAGSLPDPVIVTVTREPFRVLVPDQCPTIAAALDVVAAGGTIAIGPGYFNEQLIIDKPVILKGAGMNETTLSAGGPDGKGDRCNFPVIDIRSDQVTISGLTITGGYPGVAVNGNKAILEQNRITWNLSGDGCPNYHAGPDQIYSYGVNGMGVRVIESNDSLIRNNLIVKNGETWDGEGAGIRADNAAGMVILNNTIADNSGANGGDCGNGFGVLAVNSSGILRNNIIVNNDAWDGKHCNVKGFGIYADGTSDIVSDFNNIWDNDDTGWVPWGDNPETNDYAGLQPGQNDISVDPLFQENYRLDVQSLCIDAGDPADAWSNEPEPNGGRINMGAYGNTAEASLTAAVANAGPDQKVFLKSGTLTTVQLNGGLSRGATADLDFQWSFVSLPDGSTAALSDPAVADPTFQPDRFGIYVLSLTVNDGITASQPDNVKTVAGIAEDFEGGAADNWVPVTGSWTLSNGAYTVSSKTYEVSSAYFDLELTNFEFEADLSKTKGGVSYPTDNVALFFSGNPASITSSGNWQNGYKVAFGSGDWNLSRYLNGAFASIKNWTPCQDCGPSLGDWNTIKVVRSGSQISIYLNGEFKGSFQDSNFTTGKVGISMYDATKAGTALFDNISILELAD